MKGEKCSYCSEPAIGYVFHRGEYGANVCVHHAPDELIKLIPGENKKTEWGSITKYEVN